MDRTEFGLGDRANHSALVLALVGYVTILAVLLALGFARLLSWWVLLPAIGGSSELLAARRSVRPDSGKQDQRMDMAKIV